MDEKVTRVGVVVTFLRMDARPADPAPPLPPNAAIHIERPCSVARYRQLYDTVGADYVWWLRRTVPDDQLAELLADQAVSVHVLTLDGADAGFFELDRGHSPWSQPGWVNLSYFGLMPHAVGRHLGAAFLRAAVDAAWQGSTTAVTVNTCTADHPRALPGYLRAGFRKTREVPEQWNVPDRLGLRIPEALKL